MPLLTQDEVAAILRCHPNTVYRLRRSGKLPYIDMRPVKIRSEDLEKWITTNARKAEAKKESAKAYAADEPCRRTRMPMLDTSRARAAKRSKV